MHMEYACGGDLMDLMLSTDYHKVNVKKEVKLHYVKNILWQVVQGLD